MKLPDLDDVSRCPLAKRCAGCGSETGLAVATIEVPVGIYCQTLCWLCAEDSLPSLGGWAATVDAVCAHCVHLGIDVDQMGAAMEAGRRRSW